MRKRTGSSYNLYLTDFYIKKAQMLADETDRSTSFIVNCALRNFLENPPKNHVLMASEAMHAETTQ